MRSRIAVVVRRAAVLAAVSAVASGVGAASAEAATTPPPEGHVLLADGNRQQEDPARASVGLDDNVGGTVGIVAVALGIGGMAIGVYRRRRGLATQAEGNQRR